MEKMINRFKLKPEIYKDLITTADKLGKFQRKNNRGELMFREQTKVLTGMEILKNHETGKKLKLFTDQNNARGFHKWIINQKWLGWVYKLYIKLKIKYDKTPEPLIENQKIEPGNSYLWKFREPILVNHRINIFECYKKDGQTGVNAYVKFFNDLSNGN